MLFDRAALVLSGEPQIQVQKGFSRRKTSNIFWKNTIFENVFSVQQFSAGLPWDGILAVPSHPTEMLCHPIPSHPRPTSKILSHGVPRKANILTCALLTRVLVCHSYAWKTCILIEFNAIWIQWYHFHLDGVTIIYYQSNSTSNACKQCSNFRHFCHFNSPTFM